MRKEMVLQHFYSANIYPQKRTAETHKKEKLYTKTEAICTGEMSFVYREDAKMQRLLQ